MPPLAAGCDHRIGKMDTQQIKGLIADAVEGRALAPEQIAAAVGAMLDSQWDAAQIAGLLVALRMRGESPAQLAAAAAALRQRRIAVVADNPEELVDTCGTGGDGSHTFNVSTAAAFVAAACGVRVAKHGNRAQSGVCGSSDLIAALGADLTASPEKVAECLADTGICFMFAPAHYPAMKEVAPVRAALGVRTMFNMLGPMLNPAGAGRQVVGIFSPDLIVPYAETLRTLGSKRALVVHAGGLDEFSVCAPCQYASLAEDGTISSHSITPQQAGFEDSFALADLQVADAKQAQARFAEAIDGRPGAAAAACAFNAGAALHVAGVADDITAGVRLAQQAQADGAARAKVEQFRAFFGG